MPKMASATAKAVSLSSMSIVPSRTTDASTSAKRPACATRSARIPSPASARERRDEHRHRHREETLAGLEGVQAENDLEVDRQHEEGPEQDQLLHHQRRQPGPQRDDLEQRAVE